jgi:hypothetical protein
VFYTMSLRVTRCLMWLAIALAALYVVMIVVMLIQGFPGFAPQPSADNDIPLPALFGVAGFIAAGCASRFARTLSEENESNLPVVWTLPVSRTTYALATFAIGAVGVLAAFAIVSLAEFAFITTLRVVPFVTAPPDSALQFVRFLALPFAYYGLLTALTASYGKVGRGLIGWAWVSSFLIVGAFAMAGSVQPWRTIFGALVIVDPMHYADYSSHHGADTISIMAVPGEGTPIAVGICIIALAVLAVAGFAAGVWQWRRVEA